MGSPLSIQQIPNGPLPSASAPGNPSLASLPISPATRAPAFSTKTAPRTSTSFANDEPCPVLDPATGLCDLYAARPITCRVFGPPLRTEDGLGVCELCFHGATHEEIAACEVHLDSDSLESSLTAEAEQTAGRSGNTIVAWALAR
jgi:Fe-S-cluster containining protein